MATKQERFEFGGHTVFYKMVELGGDHEALLDNFLSGSTPQHGSAKVATVVGALSDKRGGELRIDGKKVNFRNVKKPFPRIRDENGKSLLTLLLEHIVAEEPWLAEDERYSDVFEDYLIQVDEDEYTEGDEDPTSLRLAGGGQAEE